MLYKESNNSSDHCYLFTKGYFSSSTAATANWIKQAASLQIYCSSVKFNLRREIVFLA